MGWKVHRPNTRNANEYDPNALLPKIGTVWIWEIRSPLAMAVIRVFDVFWNGEQWFVATQTLLGSKTMYGDEIDRESEHVNELGRFWEAVTPTHRWSSKDIEKVKAAKRQRVKPLGLHCAP